MPSLRLARTTSAVLSVGALVIGTLASRASAADRGTPCAARYDVTTSSAKYGRAPSEGLDLYVPRHRADARLLVFVHGGGWTEGRRNGYAPIGYAFASCGIAVATLDYTLAPAVHADAMAREVASALAWLERNATANGFATRPFFLAGHSAGAQLVAFVATLGTRVLDDAGVPRDALGGAVLLDGLFYDPPDLPADSPHAAHLSSIFGDLAAWHATYALPPKLTGKEAPMLVVYGTADTVVPEDDSKRFYDALLAAGDRARFERPADLTHSEVVTQLFSQKTDLFAQIVAFVVSGNP
jgi:arylformamidase